MNSATSWLCLRSFFVPVAIGVGLALSLQPRLGGYASLVGYGLPPVGLVTVCLALVKATPCEPHVP